jgi:spermidine synthase
MKTTCVKRVISFGALWCCVGGLQGVVVFEATSPYHQVQVLDEHGMRMLSFNGTRESRMLLTNPLQGHFEYTEYFHAPWLWNRDMRRVLMVGLGGGSIQRAYQHYYTNVTVETVEIDPMVIKAAKEYFKVQETPTLKIHNQDGRVFLNRTSERYDLIIMDAYTSGRYGSSIPPHLTTREFFALASVHLTTNGVLAYNVIGQMQGWRTDFIGAIYRTMKEIFPQVYAFPAESSMNVVLVATKSPARFDNVRAQREGAELVRDGKVKVPGFVMRLRMFDNAPPASAAKSPVLTDDRAPVESLLDGSGKSR